MGADNWGVCPKCMAKALQDKETLKFKIDKSYGKISSQAYIELIAKWNEPIDLKNTLREDYELGVEEDGSFHIDYSCSCTCTVCNFKHLFNYNQQLKVE
jgi:hypothetical protein